MSSKNTPGPWSVEEMPSGRLTVTAGQFFVAGDTNEWGLSDADARLIAAAPELLEALVRLEAELVQDKYGEDYEPSPFENLALARAAIAKAMGAA